MPSLTAEGVADLLITTQKELGELKMTMLASDLQDHIGWNDIIRNKRIMYAAGQSIQFNIMKQHSGAARHTSLYQTDDVNVGDVLATGDIPWRFTETSWSTDVREIAMNRTPRKILDHVKVKRADAMTSLAELLEPTIWGKPATSADDTTPYGVRMYVVNNATEGFNGGDPAGFAAGVAGILVADIARWKNYTARFVNISRTDLVRKLRKAMSKTNFKPPVDHPNYQRGNKYALYTDYAVWEQMSERAEDQNDSLGPDLSSMDGRTTVRRTPLTYVPYLDQDNQTDVYHPIYGINWGDASATFLRGEYFRETTPKAPAQHNVVQTFTDLVWNFVIRNRRLHFVVDRASAM